METEIKNALFKVGNRIKVQGKIHAEAIRFQIDLGTSATELALHFNPRFHEHDTDKAVLVCNSLSNGIWNKEQRDTPNPFQPGSTFKVAIKHTGSLFEVMLPDGQMIEFENRENLEVITYICIKGDISLTSLKIK